MSKLTEGLVALLVLVAIVLGGLYAYEKHSGTKAKAQVAQVTQVAQSLSQELTEAHASFRVDLDAISKTQGTKDQIVAKAISIKEKVDATSAKVQAGQLSDAAADAAYYDSMYEAYCQGSDDPACPTGPSGG